MFSLFEAVLLHIIVVCHSALRLAVFRCHFMDVNVMVVARKECGVFYNYLTRDINFLPFLSTSIIISVFIAHIVITHYLHNIFYLYSKIEDLLLVLLTGVFLMLLYSI